MKNTYKKYVCQETATKKLTKITLMTWSEKSLIMPKLGKAPGVDGLVAGLFRNKASVNMLTVLFNKYLYTGNILTVWTLGVKSPILKCSVSDPCIPLISGVLAFCQGLVSCTQPPPQTDLETNNLLADKQNGLRANRSTLDPIFSLHNKKKPRTRHIPHFYRLPESL